MELELELEPVLAHQPAQLLILEEAVEARRPLQPPGEADQKRLVAAPAVVVAATAAALEAEAVVSLE